MAVKDKYFGLLKTWLDELLTYQINDKDHPTVDGALICPACGMVHGRCADAVYPLMYMAEETGDMRYHDAAIRLFDWSETMMCDDGSMYNDFQGTWNGITVFATVALFHTLEYHSSVLSDSEKKRIEERLKTMCTWLKDGITPTSASAVINYISTNACAMAHAYKYFGDTEYLDKANALAECALSYISENGLLRGEGKPISSVTEKGCYPVDIGYNVEESLPSLLEYALITGNCEAKEKVVSAYRAHLEFMLPDGAWDNSMSSRNFKWTYFGSRTSDGCQAAFNCLGKEYPVFAEAAYRNICLYEKMTDGLLYGGPDYKKHGEKPCTHHAFCHSKVLAQALDEGVCEFERCPIPSDTASGVKHWKEIDTYRVNRKNAIMDVTGYDFNYMDYGHASGGCITLLYSRENGSVIATANTDYVMAEVQNQQLPRKKASHRPLCPRVEYFENGVRYSQMYDFAPEIGCREDENGVYFDVLTHLTDYKHVMPENGTKCRLSYELTDGSLKISGVISGKNKANFILPVISGTVKTANGYTHEPIFNLTPGFIAEEYTIIPDDNGVFGVEIIYK